MSGSEEDIEELRKQKLEQLKEQQQGGDSQEQEARQAQQEQAEAQKTAVLRQNLTDGARQRLNSVKMSKPDFGEQVEQQVFALARSGRLGDKIDEDQMRQLLQELKPDRKSFDIKHR
ncbi:MAG TPA: DNA-binding protein [Halococcus sp.]|nr:DNA-binding protein [Halococcus sp.]